MFLKRFHPEPEVEMLIEDLKWLDWWNNGPDWFYLPKEKSRYYIRRMKLVARIMEMDDTFVDIKDDS